MARTGLTCPKCSGAWGTHERNGVVIEECEGCQGVFLDRGELERLLDAENEYLAELPPEVDPATGYQGKHRRGVMSQVFTPAE